MSTERFYATEERRACRPRGTPEHDRCRGHRPPGQPIRTDEIASALGVSRVAGERISSRFSRVGATVRHIPRQGFEVADLPIGDLFRHLPGSRELLESEALSYGVPRLTGEGIEAIRKAKHDLETDDGSDIMQTIDANTRFHLTAIEASDKPVLSRTLRILWESATPSAIRLMMSTERSLIHKEHDHMFDALVTRKTEAVDCGLHRPSRSESRAVKFVLDTDPHGLDPAPPT